VANGPEGQRGAPVFDFDAEIVSAARAAQPRRLKTPTRVRAAGGEPLLEEVADDGRDEKAAEGSVARRPRTRPSILLAVPAVLLLFGAAYEVAVSPWPLPVRTAASLALVGVGLFGLVFARLLAELVGALRRLAEREE
jgi:hypothetical protein